MKTERRFLFFLLVFCVMAFPASAIAVDLKAEENMINYAYLADFGIGVYNVEERQVRAFQVPFSYQIRPMQDDQWGLRLLFPVTFADFDADVVDTTGIEIPLDARVVGANPGVELQIPMRRNWVLKPFGKIGMGRDVSGGENALLYSAGIKSIYLIPWKHFQFAFGTGVFFDAYNAEGEGHKDFASVGFGLDAIYPLGLTLFGRQSHIGAYVAYHYYFDELEFERIGRPPIEISDQIEIAMTFGVYDPIPIWFFKFRRIGLAYRYGEDLEAIRIVFGFPF